MRGPGRGGSAIAGALLDEVRRPKHVAAAFIRLWREGRSAPEVLWTTAAAGQSASAAAPERGEFGPSVWFALSVGHTGRAEARWLLPKICEAGGITKDAIGAIRVQQDQTFVQIAADQASKFGTALELDHNLTMTRLDGEPDFDRAPAPRAPRTTERPAPKPRAFAEDRAPRAASEERAPRVAKAYASPKPPRVVEDDAPAYTPAPRAPSRSAS